MTTDPEPEPMQAGVVNVLLTIDPVASHAAGRYVTWDGTTLDEEETVRCDAATPHELWAWTITTDEAPGAPAEPRADVRRLTTIVAGAAAPAPEVFNEAMLAHFASCRARDVLGPGAGQAGAAEPGAGETGAAEPGAGETAAAEPGAGETAAAESRAGETAPRDSGPAGEYCPYPAIFRATALAQIFRDTVLPGLAGAPRDEALDILGRLEQAATPTPDATPAPDAIPAPDATA